MSEEIESRLRRRVADELFRPAPVWAQRLCRAIRARHGDCVAAVLFHGSCLRKQTHEGVLDFYVVVDSYRSCYESRWLALLNAIVPPNVFYLETASELGTLRAKYAVLSRRQFERLVSARARHPYIWARFAQPSLAIYTRDVDARDLVLRCAVLAITTLVRRLGVFLPAKGRLQRFSLAALWQEAFRRPYGSELRTESPETVRSHYEVDPERYDAVGADALALLEAEGWLDRVRARGKAVEVEMSRWRRLRTRWRWHWLRPVGKLLALVRLVKNAATFGDWLPYVLWKIERHTGTKVELSDRQRRHPLIFGWPVLMRLLLRRDLH